MVTTSALEQYKGEIPTNRKLKTLDKAKLGVKFKNKKRLRLVLVATTLLAALEQDKGELPTNRKFRTLMTRQSRLPTVYNVYKSRTPWGIVLQWRQEG